MSLFSRARQRLIDGRPGIRVGRAEEFAKSMLVVVPLTVMIWIYAERAQSFPDKVSLSIAAGAAEPNLIAEVIEPSERQSLEVSVYGPRGRIEELKKQFEKVADGGRFRITLTGGDASVGPHDFDAVQLLNRDPLIAASGVTVTDANPKRVRVAVEQLESRQAKVVLQTDSLKVELINYSFEPQAVTLTGPQSAFPLGIPVVQADPSALTANDEAGAQTIDVPLVPPTDRRLKLSATKVKMTYAAGASVRIATVPTAFIDIVRPAGDADGKSKVVLTSGNVVHNVQIRGPTSLVSKYVGASPSATLRLQLPVKHEDIGQSNIERNLTPVPVEDGQVKIEGGPYKVTFDVRED